MTENKGEGVAAALRDVTKIAELLPHVPLLRQA